MGTNYYLHSPKCFHCGKEEEPPIHFGKSSAGWCFSLQGALQGATFSLRF